MDYLQVKNWDRFQHYKKQDGAFWIKLYHQLLSDYEFNKLTELEQCRLMKIWLLAARTGNRIPQDPAWVKAQIGAKTLDLDLYVSRGWLEPVYTDPIDALAPAEVLRSTDIEQQKYLVPDLPLAKLLKALTDRDERTESTIRRLAERHRLAEGDFMWALECATGPGVNSPTRVAVGELTKRGREKAAA